MTSKDRLDFFKPLLQVYRLSGRLASRNPDQQKPYWLEYLLGYQRRSASKYPKTKTGSRSDVYRGVERIHNRVGGRDRKGACRNC